MDISLIHRGTEEPSQIESISHAADKITCMAVI
jgi:hypothetical protein